MFEAMLRIRMIEESIAVLYAEQEMRCPTHLCLGQEAPPVGISTRLRVSDLVFSGHRSHGHYLAKGGDLRSMVAELYGRETGCARGKGGSQHLIDLDCGFMGSAPILASTISVAVGAAWAAQMSEENRVVVVYFGDAATEEGTFHEAMNFAGLKRLPVIFVCENNLYSVHSPLGVRQPPRTIASMGAAYGIEAERADGNDVELVYRLAGQAVRRARKGDGPTLLEFLTYRWAEHCGPNDDIHLGYRSAEELHAWKLRDPLKIARQRLIRNGELDDDLENVMTEKIRCEIDGAVVFAKQSPFPHGSELYAHVFPNRENVA